MILRNPRHERFAQELAAGKSASEAYVLAGYKHNTGNASALKAQESISTRVDEILSQRERKQATVAERAIERAAISKADIIQMLLDDRELARSLEQPAPAIRAAELIGKEIGMFIDRRESGKPGEFAEQLTDAELTDIARGGGDRAADAPASPDKSRSLH